MRNLRLGEDWLTPNLCVIKENNCVNFQKYIPKNNYLTMLALKDGFQAKLSGNTVEYKIDSGEWTTLASNTYTPTVNAGQRIYFKGNLTPSSNKGIGTFSTNKRYNLEGNCMSMLFGDEAEGKTDLTGKNYAFMCLFSGSTYLVEVERDFLPATTLAERCYYQMFRGCTSLTTATKLPATTLANYCYRDMFSGCTSLVTVQELPATTLANYCYQSMFNGCTSLVTAPELPATTLASYCYNYMFYNCTSLVTAPELPATTLADNCYYYMFQKCTSLVNAPELPATTLADRCYNGMFSGTNVIPDCSNIDFSSSSVVQSGGLRGLFAGTKVTDEILNNILPKNNEGKYCLPATELAASAYTYMFEDCTSLVTAPELPATTLNESCYQGMFYGCTSLTQAPELPATELAASAYTSMFKYCTSLVNAPELPATTLADRCYDSMFYGCSNLNNITMLATDISATNCLSYWVSGVASTGTFTKATSMTSLPSGSSGIPSGWTVQDYNS